MPQVRRVIKQSPSRPTPRRGALDHFCDCRAPFPASAQATEWSRLVDLQLGHAVTADRGRCVATAHALTGSVRPHSRRPAVSCWLSRHGTQSVFSCDTRSPHEPWGVSVPPPQEWFCRVMSATKNSPWIPSSEAAGLSSDDDSQLRAP